MSEYRGYVPPEVQNQNERPKAFVIADITEARKAAAKDAVNAKLSETEPKPTGLFGRIKSYAKNVWKQSDFNRFLEQRKAENAIKEKNSLYANEQYKEVEAKEGRSLTDAEKEQRRTDEHKATVEAITDRFGGRGDFEEEFIHKEAGEGRRVLDNSHESNQIKNRIQALVKAYARGELHGGISEQDFVQHKNQILAEVAGQNADLMQKGGMYADNLLDIAKWAKEEVRKQVEQRVDHETAIRNLDLNFDVAVGKAKAGVRTEAQHNAVEKAVDWIQSHTGGVMNETAVAAGVAAFYVVSKKLITKSVTKAAAMFGVGMAASGGLAAVKEGRKLETERMQHAREMAQGRKEVNPRQGDRRSEFEASRIQTKSAKELVDGLGSKINRGKEVREFTEAEFNEAVAALSEIDARIKVSDRGIEKKVAFRNKNHRVDLIGYSDMAKVDQERMVLDVARAKARKQLKDWAQAHGKNWDSLADIAVNNKISELYGGDTGITKQNERFSKLKKQKMWSAFKRGALVGGAIGLAYQEIAAFANDQEGLLEHGVQNLRGHGIVHGHGEKTTLAEGAFHRAKEYGQKAYDYFTGTVHAAGPMHNEMIGSHEFKLPDTDMQIREIPGHPGDYEILDKGQVITDQPLHVDANGHFDTASQDYLRQHGFNPVDGTDTVAGGSRHLDLNETKNKFPDLDKHKRSDWHGPTYKHVVHGDGTEEMVPWTGKVDQSKIGEFLFLNKQQQMFLEMDKSGNVFANVHKMMDNLVRNLDDDQIKENPELFGIDPTKMTPETIDEKLKEIHAALQQALDNGELEKGFQIAIIPTEAANQAGLSHLIEGAGTDGRIQIDAEYAKYFKDPSMLRDGKIPFRFMEVRWNGHVFATAHAEDPGFGEGSHTVDYTLLTRPEGRGPDDIYVVPPPAFYHGTRRPLEETRRNYIPSIPRERDGGDEEDVYPYRPREISLQERRVLLQDMSPRLQQSPEAELNPQTEIEWYFQDQERRFPGYTAELEALLQQQQGVMGKKVEAVAALAVAGHQEQKNIYRTLQTYAAQVDRDGDSVWKGRGSKYEVDLFVNWPQGENADETLAEIERFKQDHPEVNVQVFKQEIPGGKKELGRIKKKIFDLALLRHAKRKNGKDITIIANDADMEYCAPTYLEDVASYMGDDDHKDVDMVLGRQDLNPDVYAKNPTFHSAMRFWQFMEAGLRTKHQIIGTQGRNTIMRGSVYAAIGGNRDMGFAADTEFTRLLQAARNGKNTLGYLNRAWVMVDPRREIDKFKSGEVIAATWADFDTRQGIRGGGKAEHQAPEDMDLEKLAAAVETNEDVVKFKERLEEEINAILFAFFPDVDRAAAEKLVQTTCERLGVEVNIATYNEGGRERFKVAITDTHKLRSRLLAYKQEGRQDVKLKDQPEELKPFPSVIAEEFNEKPLRLLMKKDELKDLAEGNGLPIKDVVVGLYKQHGFTEADYAAGAARANMRGRSEPQRALAGLVDMLMDGDPAYRKQVQDVDPKNYKDFVLKLSVEKVLHRKYKSKESLSEKEVSDLAAKYNLSTMEIIMQGYTGDFAGQEKDAEEKLQDGMTRGIYTEADRETVYREVLSQKLEGKFVPVKKAPTKGPGKKGGAGGGTKAKRAPAPKATATPARRPVAPTPARVELPDDELV